MYIQGIAQSMHFAEVIGVVNATTHSCVQAENCEGSTTQISEFSKRSTPKLKNC